MPILKEDQDCINRFARLSNKSQILSQKSEQQKVRHRRRRSFHARNPRAPAPHVSWARAFPAAPDQVCPLAPSPPLPPSPSSVPCEQKDLLDYGDALAACEEFGITADEGEMIRCEGGRPCSLAAVGISSCSRRWRRGGLSRAVPCTRDLRLVFRLPAPPAVNKQSQRFGEAAAAAPPRCTPGSAAPRRPGWSCRSA